MNFDYDKHRKWAYEHRQWIKHSWHQLLESSVIFKTPQELRQMIVQGEATQMFDGAIKGPHSLYYYW